MEEKDAAEGKYQTFSEERRVMCMVLCDSEISLSVSTSPKEAFLAFGAVGAEGV